MHFYTRAFHLTPCSERKKTIQHTSRCSPEVVLRRQYHGPLSLLSGLYRIRDWDHTLTSHSVLAQSLRGLASLLKPPILAPICRTILTEIGSVSKDVWSPQCRLYFFKGDQNSYGPITVSPAVNQWGELLSMDSRDIIMLSDVQYSLATRRGR